MTEPHRAPPDPGRQAERTILAHWRTELAVVVVAASIARQARPGHERLLVVAFGGLAVVVVVTAGWLRQQRLAHPAPVAAPRHVWWTVAGLLTLQALAILVVL